jgi:long-subunit acyl-CoA synthetase (AMP-forming)
VRGEAGAVLSGAEAGELWVRGPQVFGEYLGSGSAVDSGGRFPTRDRAWSTSSAEGVLLDLEESDRSS